MTKRLLRCDTTCESCGTDYFYIDEVEVKETDSTKYFEKLEKMRVEGTRVVPCPSCKKMSKTMWKRWFGEGVSMLFAAAACLGGLVLIMSLFDDGVVLLWGLGLICLAGLGLTVLGLLAWPFEPLINRGDAILPGREDEAKDDAKIRWMAWNAVWGEGAS